MVEQVVASPSVARSEALRVVAQTAPNGNVLHGWRALPQGSRDLLAFEAFCMLVRERRAQTGTAAA
jgi:hypothetical protein